MSFKRIMAVLAVASLVLTATVAQAGVVAIQNPSFESSMDPAWVVVDEYVAGRYQPVGDGWPAAAHDGTWAAFAYSSNGGRFYQKLKTDGSTEYQFASVGDTLTVNFYLSKHTTADDVNLHVNLWTDTPDPMGSGGYIYDSGGLTPTATATWEFNTFTYIAKEDDIGETLWLQFDHSQGDDAFMADSVSASYTPIPEPSTLVLLIAGLAGLLCYAWRKRK